MLIRILLWCVASFPIGVIDGLATLAVLYKRHGDAFETVYMNGFEDFTKANNETFGIPDNSSVSWNHIVAFVLNTIAWPIPLVRYHYYMHLASKQYSTDKIES